MNWYVLLFEMLSTTPPLFCPHLPLPSPLAPTCVLLAMMSELYLTLVRTVKMHCNLF